MSLVEIWYENIPPTEMGYSRKYPHTAHGRHWRSWKKCSVSMTGNPQASQNFVNFNRNSRETIQIFSKFWNSSRLWMSRLWNPAKTAVVLLGNPEIFRYPIGCRPWGGGGVDVSWNSPVLSSLRVAKKHVHVYCFHGKHFVCWDLRGMLETTTLPRRIVNRLYLSTSKLRIFKNFERWNSWIW